MLPPKKFGHFMPGGIKRNKASRASKIADTPVKPDLFQIQLPPISWGTVPMLLPPVVRFKKNFQKSYENDIPKQNQRKPRVRVEQC